jgi:NitT/TauT family transport system ATP-binding protein
VSKLEIKGVSKQFGAGDTVHRVLDDVGMRIAEGEFVTLLGPSGCGKTTLLTIVAGFQHADEGVVLLSGNVTDGPGPDRGFVFQSYALFPWMNVRDNVLFPMRQVAMSAEDQERRLAELLALAHLSGKEHLYPHQLSGGMKQRTALVRALACSPEVLLMDEPLGALDYQMRMLLQGELEAIFMRERVTVLMVTHDVEEAVFLSDRVLVMGLGGGRIVRDLKIDLPRPRQRKSERYHHYKDVLTDALRDAMGGAGLEALERLEMGAAQAELPPLSVEEIEVGMMGQ